MNLNELNCLNDERAIAAFLGCCGSSRWARLMVAVGPFGSPGAMADAADHVWRSLEPSDWLDAFAAHPRIGSGGSGWSDQEQAGVRSASADIRTRLADRNREYEARFGYIFIVCATGRSAAEMLAMLEQRLENDPDVELAIAAEEQRKITRLRLAKLLADTQLPTP